jgi:hypothetical protein
MSSPTMEAPSQLEAFDADPPRSTTVSGPPAVRSSASAPMTAATIAAAATPIRNWRLRGTRGRPFPCLPRRVADDRDGQIQDAPAEEFAGDGDNRPVAAQTTRLGDVRLGDMPTPRCGLRPWAWSLRRSSRSGSEVRVLRDTLGRSSPQRRSSPAQAGCPSRLPAPGESRGPWRGRSPRLEGEGAQAVPTERRDRSGEGEATAPLRAERSG